MDHVPFAVIGTIGTFAAAIIDSAICSPPPRTCEPCPECLPSNFTVFEPCPALTPTKCEPCALDPPQTFTTTISLTPTPVPTSNSTLAETYFCGGGEWLSELKRMVLDENTLKLIGIFWVSALTLSLLLWVLCRCCRSARVADLRRRLEAAVDDERRTTIQKTRLADELAESRRQLADLRRRLADCESGRSPRPPAGRTAALRTTLGSLTLTPRLEGANAEIPPASSFPTGLGSVPQQNTEDSGENTRTDTRAPTSRENRAGALRSILWSNLLVRRLPGENAEIPSFLDGSESTHQEISELPGFDQRRDEWRAQLEQKIENLRRTLAEYAAISDSSTNATRVTGEQISFFLRPDMPINRDTLSLDLQRYLSERFEDFQDSVNHANGRLREVMPTEPLKQVIDRGPYRSGSSICHRFDICDKEDETESDEKTEEPVEERPGKTSEDEHEDEEDASAKSDETQHIPVPENRKLRLFGNTPISKDSKTHEDKEVASAQSDETQDPPPSNRKLRLGTLSITSFGNTSNSNDTKTQSASIKSKINTLLDPKLAASEPDKSKALERAPSPVRPHERARTGKYDFLRPKKGEPGYLPAWG